MDLTTEQGVTNLMESSKSEKEWNENCDKVQTANGGYPQFWYPLIILSGLMKKVQDNWSK